MKKKVTLGLLIVVFFAALLATYYRSSIQRAAFASTLFTGAEQVENFGRLSEVFPHTTMTAAAVAHNFPEQLDVVLPDSFSHNGKRVQTNSF